MSTVPAAARVLALDPGVAASARLASLGARIAHGRARGAIALVGCGLAAGAATALVDFDLRIPGHAILRAVVPMAVGLSLVPRRGGATLMAASAAAIVVVLGGGRAVAGPGALTSLLLLGPVLDAALRRAGSGRRIVVAFALGGLVTNAAAFGIRLADKLLAPGVTRPVGAWWPGAVASYLACGLVAGTLAAALCFRWSARAREPRGA